MQKNGVWIEFVAFMWQQKPCDVFFLRAGLCCRGCRGWKLKGCSWRSPAGWSTPLSWTRFPNTVSSYSHSTILSVCLCSQMLSLSLFLPLCPAQFISPIFPVRVSASSNFSLPLLSYFLYLCLYFSCCPLSFTQSPFLSHSLFKGAEVHYVNMTPLTKGHLLSSFWVVDRRHFYIGSASMDWRSLATVSNFHYTFAAVAETHTLVHIHI